MIRYMDGILNYPVICLILLTRKFFFATPNTIRRIFYCNCKCKVAELHNPLLHPDIAAITPYVRSRNLPLAK